jgi:peptidoglycan-associated lipoprotein
MKKLVISIVLLNLLAACASQKPKEVAAAPAAAPVAATAASAATAQTNMDPLNDPKSILAGRSVYYPFDVAAVQDADKPLVQAHAKYLSETRITPFAWKATAMSAAATNTIWVWVSVAPMA